MSVRGKRKTLAGGKRGERQGGRQAGRQAQKRREKEGEEMELERASRSRRQ